MDYNPSDTELSTSCLSMDVCKCWVLSFLLQASEHLDLNSQLGRELDVMAPELRIMASKVCCLWESLSTFLYQENLKCNLSALLQA